MLDQDETVAIVDTGIGNDRAGDVSSESTAERQHEANTVQAAAAVTRHWPVPQIVLFYSGGKRAMGREEIALMGMREFMKCLFMLFVWDRPPYTTFQDHHYNGHKFSKQARVNATFYHTHGDHDVGPIVLSAIGWSEMIQNVVTITLEYDDA